MNNNNLQDLLINWLNDKRVAENITTYHVFPEKAGEYIDFPNEIDPQIIEALSNLGITQLYQHQFDGLEHIFAGKNLVLCSGTASGKSLCYNIPVIQTLLQDLSAKSMFLFPTKALAQDQLKNFSQLNNEINKIIPNSIQASVYDGDTQSSKRKQIRETARLIFTNPDMLHFGILPQHDNWKLFLQGLKFIILDEIHIYKGVFGSHIANVIRRLKRILHYYGAAPQFIMTSATINNPVELSEKLIEESVELVCRDGSPRGKKHFLLYNPPFLNEELSIRHSPLYEGVQLSKDLIHQDIQTILFSKTRKSVEILYKDIIESVPEKKANIRSYRSGYLAGKRREIEDQLKSGHARLVSATNALELGIDIGGVDCVMMVSYPDSISATIQQAGRAGRKMNESLAILIASQNPIDQFIIQNPDFLFGNNPENALIDPDNLLILMGHIQCAAYELPFHLSPGYGNLSTHRIDLFLDLLTESNILLKKNKQYFWVSKEYPPELLSLRSSSAERIILKVLQNNKPKSLGEIDKLSAYWMVHPGAIFLQEGLSHLVEYLDLEHNEALLRENQSSYFTQARRKDDIEIKHLIFQNHLPYFTMHLGEIMVTSTVVGFKKIDWESRAILSIEDLDMPSTELYTTGFWFILKESSIKILKDQNNWSGEAIQYGPNWSNQKELARKRDGFTCKVCGLSENNQRLHVHHITPFRKFDTYENANNLYNLITLCPACHKKAELSVKIKSGLSSLSYAMKHFASILLMCDIHDLISVAEIDSPLFEGKPGVMLYETIPGGIGFSQALYSQIKMLFTGTRQLIMNCKCKDGCPSCVGPSSEIDLGNKKEALAILDLLCEDFLPKPESLGNDKSLLESKS
ncbi:MAG: DEAD/DEAH box helicase [Bacteroidales bacterium]|nr:DEAD/DEAH box helicase [Bacteroidales bacterium]